MKNAIWAILGFPLFTAFLGLLAVPTALAQSNIPVATPAQRTRLVQQGVILPAATIIGRLEANGGQVLDLDLYLPNNNPGAWFYGVIYRDASGRVTRVNIGAVQGDLR